MKKSLILLAVLTTTTLFAQESSVIKVDPQTFAGKSEVNGIVYADYKEFPTTWQLVTIRFRKDTGEMRLTYANELALKTLMSGSINYPDGAIFAKTNVRTMMDEQYPNSIAPKELSRYQFMVRNKDKYASTNGWGYGIFDPDGKTFPEEPAKMANACYSCHTAVENRGDVFSRPFSFIEKVKMPNYNPPKELALKYSWVKWSELTPELKKIIPKSMKKVRVLVHQKMMDNTFQGTLDELKPLLIDEAKTHKAPAFFMASDKKRFVVAVPSKNEKCNDFAAIDVTSTALDLSLIHDSVCKDDSL